MMNTFPTPYIYFFAANLIFLFSCAFCAYMRWMHTCDEYKYDLDWFYPARKPYIVIYLLAMLEFPYLLDVFSPDALLYARVFMAITYPLFIYILFERYFFYTHFSTRHIIAICITPVVLLLPLAYFALRGGATAVRYETDIILLSTIICAVEVYAEMKTARKLYKRAKAEAEKEYSSSEDFPTVMAKKLLRCLPLSIIVCVILPSLFSSGWIKLVRDILLAIFDLWVTAVTLRSYRLHKTAIAEEEDTEDIAESQFTVLLDKIVREVISQGLYLNPKVRLEDLVSAVGSNRKYVSKAISESKWQSFYRLINSLRVARALELKEDYPAMKQEELAERSGFASRFTLNRWMKTWEKGELDEQILEELR
jgi:AraC-like DNA-binding protein